MTIMINAIVSMTTTASFVTRCSHSSIDRSSQSHPAPAGGPDRRPSLRLGGLRVFVLLEASQHLVEVEAGGLLALRIFPEGLQEVADIRLRRHQQINVADQPIIVGVRGDVGALERIGTEVKDL